MHRHLANIVVPPAQMKNMMNSFKGDKKKVYDHLRDQCQHPTDENIELEIISGNHSRAAKEKLRVEHPDQADLHE
jgi:hypothetical protein